MAEVKNAKRFKGRIVRTVWTNDTDFWVYAVEVDHAKYPYIARTKYGNVAINGNLGNLATNVIYEITAVPTEDKYGITINYDNIQYWFTRSKDYYEEYDEQYKEFLSYKGRCLVSVQYDCGLSSCQIAKRIYDVLDKDLRNNGKSLYTIYV